MSLIALKNIRREFLVGKEQVIALNDVSLEINEGEFVAITGPSGCGKTTLMNILGLLDQPDQGTFEFDRERADHLKDDELAKMRNQKIGFVFQSFHLLPRMTALRNVELPLVYSASYDRKFSREVVRDRALKAMVRVGLGDRIDHRPNELSGGQRQRVAIARAIVNEPRILLADEPTGNLDSRSGADILSLFESLNHSGVTLILVTHDPRIAERAGRIISMLDGRVERDYARN